MPNNVLVPELLTALTAFPATSTLFLPYTSTTKDLSICVQVPYTVTLQAAKTFIRNATHQLADVPHSTSCWGMQVEDNKHVSTFVFLRS